MKPNKNQSCNGSSNHKSEVYPEHPLVYLAYDKNGWAQCPYCGREFVKEHSESQSEDFDCAR